MNMGFKSSWSEQSCSLSWWSRAMEGKWNLILTLSVIWD